MSRKILLMKTTKKLILLFLLLQAICCDSFAQPICNQGQQNKTESSSIFKRIGDLLASIFIQFTQPVDPNEIIGLDGYNVPESTDILRWVSATQTLAYTVYFENDADLAMAAARKVSVTVPLHEKLNFATFGVGSPYSRSSKSSMVASLTCIHDIMLEIPLANCVRGGMVLPPSGIKPPRKHSLTQTCDNRVV